MTRCQQHVYGITYLALLVLMSPVIVWAWVQKELERRECGR